MKRILISLFLIVFSMNFAFAEEIAAETPAETTQETPAETPQENSTQANQIIEMVDNKINVIVMKQPLNESSNQKITLKRNWLGVYVQINGKVKVNPLTHTYEVE